MEHVQTSSTDVKCLLKEKPSHHQTLNSSIISCQHCQHMLKILIFFLTPFFLASHNLLFFLININKLYLSSPGKKYKSFPRLESEQNRTCCADYPIGFQVYEKKARGVELRQSFTHTVKWLSYKKILSWPIFEPWGSQLRARHLTDWAISEPR